MANLTTGTRTVRRGSAGRNTVPVKKSFNRIRHERETTIRMNIYESNPKMKNRLRKHEMLILAVLSEQTNTRGIENTNQR